jgi:2-hydroxy-4-carboxymuconate semialdehyde hemiacetal dehydrogenase
LALRLGLAGYGAVASVHARRLAGGQAQLSCVFGPNLDKAQQFARRHGIASATDRFEELLTCCDAVIIASPTGCHFAQALEALDSGRHVLVELPPCAGEAEARRLGEAAARRGVTLGCAHTSRYLQAYRLVGDQIREGRLGIVAAVQYTRCLALRPRSWRDDALLHHAAHPLDLFLNWFPGFELVAAIARPPSGPRCDVSFLGRTAAGAPITAWVSYSSRDPKAELLVAGQEHTLATDGFSFVRRDGAELLWASEAEAAYEDAIGLQDTDFVRACQGSPLATPWAETVRLMRALDRLALLAGEDRSPVADSPTGGPR